jgi:predicted exporter
MNKVSVAQEGVVVGVIASASVAVFYAAFDLLAARGPLYTVNVLGRALFRELRHPSVLMLPMSLDWGAILMYSLLHLLLSLGIGLTVVWLVSVAERASSGSLPALALIVAGFVATILVVGYLSASIRPVLPWWSIVVANSLSVALAGAYLLRRHPGLWERLRPARA